MQGVCPECGSYDNLYLTCPIYLIPAELQSVEKNGKGGVKAIIHQQDSFLNAVPAPEKYYCDNCNQYFKMPKFVK